MPVKMNCRENSGICMGNEVAYEYPCGQVSHSISQREIPTCLVTWWIAAEGSESCHSLSSGNVMHMPVSWRNLWASVTKWVNRCWAVSRKCSLKQTTPPPAGSSSWGSLCHLDCGISAEPWWPIGGPAKGTYNEQVCTDCFGNYGSGQRKAANVLRIGGWKQFFSFYLLFFHSALHMIGVHLMACVWLIINTLGNF